MSAHKTQVDKFRETACDLEADENAEAFDHAFNKIVSAPAVDKKVCPECGHVFKGNGWDGIDAHWKSKHEAVMPYAEAWPLLSAGTYPDKG